MNYTVIVRCYFGHGKGVHGRCKIRFGSDSTASASRLRSLRSLRRSASAVSSEFSHNFDEDSIWDGFRPVMKDYADLLAEEWPNNPAITTAANYIASVCAKYIQVALPCAMFDCEVSEDSLSTTIEDTNSPSTEEHYLSTKLKG